MPRLDVLDRASARDRLLAVATKLFIAQGFAGTPVSAIVREAGVTMPVLYYHFENKLNLLRAVIQSRGAWIGTDLPIDPTLDLETNCAAVVAHAIKHIEEVRDGLRLRLLLDFERGPEVDDLHTIMVEQRQRNLARASVQFASLLPGVSPRRAACLSDMYLSGVQSLALELMGGTGEKPDVIGFKGSMLARSLTLAATFPEDELPAI